MKYLRLIILTIITFAFLSCDLFEDCIDGKGTIISKSLNLSNFEGIDFAIAGDVIISQGNVQQVVARDHNILNDLKKKIVTGNIWVIEFEKECYNKYELTIHITVPNINDISLSGSGAIIVNDFANQNDLSLNISGSGDVEINSFSGSDKFTVDISGSGNVTANDNTLDLSILDINISGSGKYDGFPIKTNDCNISISGSGNCYVNVIERLDVNISGSGNIYL